MTVQWRCFGSRSIVRELLTSSSKEVNIQLNAQTVLLNGKVSWVPTGFEDGCVTLLVCTWWQVAMCIVLCLHMVTGGYVYCVVSTHGDRWLCVLCCVCTWWQVAMCIVLCLHMVAESLVCHTSVTWWWNAWCVTQSVCTCGTIGWYIMVSVCTLQQRKLLAPCGNWTVLLCLYSHSTHSLDT